ncbi:MAG: response regulator [Bacteroidota bacterium]|nr:response regulator [Bacteroidota bacterium]
MKKILVIDDLPENVLLLREKLEEAGYEVITAFDGKSGIQVTENELPDLVMLDVMMPEIDGLEVCKIICRNEKTSFIPIILVTAKSGAEDIKEGLEAGAFDYIKKPFNKIELLARVGSALKFSEARKMLVESEKKNIYAATVVTANHKIKQPLTLMSLSLSAIRRELSKEELSKDFIESRLVYISTAIKEITDVLNQLNAVKQPIFSDYIKNIKMINVEKSDEHS